MFHTTIDVSLLSVSVLYDSKYEWYNLCYRIQEMQTKSREYLN